VATGLSSVIDTLLSMIAILIPFGIGAKMVAEGKISIGDVIIFNTMFGNVKSFFMNLITNIGTCKSANGALARLYEPEEGSLNFGSENANRYSLKSIWPKGRMRHENLKETFLSSIRRQKRNHHKTKVISERRDYEKR